MIIIFFILGLILGSFLNVVVFRLNLAETLLGRSHCPHCKAKIRWHDNVPILSFIFLGAKCRDCAGKISWQYPMVEIFTGIVFAFIGSYFFSIVDMKTWIETLFFLGAFSMLIVIAMYDLKYMEIPMLVLWSAVIWTIIFSLILDWINFSPIIGLINLKIFSGILAGIAAFLFFFLLSYLSKEKLMGMGDAYLGLLTGLVVGWPQIIFALMLSFFFGSISGIFLILKKKKTMKSQIPFAPFLVLGIFASVFVFQAFPEIQNYFWMFY
jgi:prepilin signal peptidase PulO-like enzyme (type II secretory pathway)